MRPVLLAAGYLNEDIVALVDRVPEFGGRATAKSISRTPGGMTANLACAAARLGLVTRFFGGVGRDDAGSAALANLERFGVYTEGVVRTERPTTTALVLLSPNGDRSIVSEPMAFDYGPLKRALDSFEEEAGCLHMDGYRLPEALDLLRRARELGLATSADLDGMEPEALAEYVTKIASALDVAFMNRRLASVLAENPEEAAERLVELGANVVAVTLGAQGALVAESGELVHVPTAQVAPVRDTTGAGDVFAAAFLASWLEGEQVEKACKFAVAASELSVSGTGARGYLPSREEVTEIVRSTEVNGLGSGERRGA
jgi:sugar/nucleoside kinase (ribokinase family)